MKKRTPDALPHPPSPSAARPGEEELPEGHISLACESQVHGFFPTYWLKQDMFESLGHIIFYVIYIAMFILLETRQHDKEVALLFWKILPT